MTAGISRRVYSDTRVIFITIIAIYIALAEKIGTPLIRRWHLSGEAAANARQSYRLVEATTR
jgi:hypothetical protein